MRVFLAAVAFLVLNGTHRLAAQTATNLGPAVQQYVSVNAPVIALTNVRVVDGTGAPAVENQTIVISGGHIQAVGRSGTVQPPAGAQVIDLTGQTVIPGLVGMHDHFYYTSGGREIPQPYSAPRLYLGAGVTTIRTVGSVNPYADLNLRRTIAAGQSPGPRMFINGPYLNGPGNSFGRYALESPDDARKQVNYWVDEGVRWFKAYTSIDRARLKASIEEAHKRGAKLTGHICAVTFNEAIELGIDNLEHGILIDTGFDPDKKPDECPRGGRNALLDVEVNGPQVQALIQNLVKHNVAITSTLAVWETMVPNRPAVDQRVFDAMHPQVREEVMAQRNRIAQEAGRAPMEKLFKKEQDFEFAFVKAGGMLVAGIDPTGYGAAIPGYGDQRQVELLVETGFTPVQAIQIATSNGAKLLGELDRFGTITSGKLADLLVIRGDPSRNIQDIRNVVTVFKEGIGYDSAKLLESVKGRLGMQ